MTSTTKNAHVNQLYWNVYTI